MDKELNISLQDWLNDPMLATQPNRGQSCTPLFQDMDETTGAQRQSTQFQSVDTNSTSELSSFLMSSRLNLGTLMKFVCIEFLKCSKDELSSLRLIDLTQDSTFPQTLTLRNVQTERTHYKFYNTINRDRFITSCPVFAIAVYSFITWRHTAISWKNFMNLPLILDSKDIIMLQSSNQLRAAPLYSDKMVRATVTPKKDMLGAVFPWLPALERDYAQHDRSNYVLFAVVELFQYLARVLLQDVAFLQCTGQLPHLQELVKSELSWQFLESDDWNAFKDEMQRQIDEERLQNDWFNSVCDKLDDKFGKLATQLAAQNDKLAAELAAVKTQLAAIAELVHQTFQAQRQPVASYQPANLASQLNSYIGQPMTSMQSNADSAAYVPYGASYPRLTEKRAVHNQQLDSLKRMKLDAKETSGFNASRRLPQPQSPLQMGSPLEALLSKPIPSPKITVAMLNNSTASPPPNPMGMSPLPSIAEPLSIHNNNGATTGMKIDTNGASDDGSMSSQMTRHSSKKSEGSSVSDYHKQASHKTQISENSYQDDGYNGEDSKSRLQLSVKGKKGRTNQNIKYKLSRQNKTIWDLYTEWYHGFDGKLSIKELIERYGYRRWKVTDDSHFFPTRRIIIDYIESEIDRSVSLNRFEQGDPVLKDRDTLRKRIVQDLETFREKNGLTLNSLSLYFKNLTRWGKEICMYDNFKDWSLIAMDEEEKFNLCRRKNTSKENKDENNSQEEIE